MNGLTRRYSVRERTTARDDRGVRGNTYTEKFKVWGELPREARTASFSDGGVLRSEDVLRFRCRYHPDIQLGDQFVDLANGWTMYVTSVLPLDTTRQRLQIVATQQPSPGT